MSWPADLPIEAGGMPERLKDRLKGGDSGTTTGRLRERTLVGHPVDVATGSVFTAATDLRIPGMVPIRWRRFYSTATDGVTPLGRGWSCLWFVTLRRTDDRFVLSGEEGADIAFTEPTADSASVNAAAEMELRRRGESLVVYYWHHRQRFVFEPTSDPEIWRLQAVENLAGDQAQLSYDRSGRLRSIVDPVGRQLVIGYCPAGFLSQVQVEWDGRSIPLVRYRHDDAGNLLEAVDPAGGATVYEYDFQGRLTTETNRLGGRFHFTYDEDGRCVHTWGSGGYLERKLEYLASPPCVRVTDARGASTHYHLDAQGRVERIVDPAGGETVRLRAGTLRQEVGPTGAVTLKEFDGEGHLVRLTGPTGETTTYEYNDLHLCVRRTNPDGNAWEFDYDELGRPRSVTRPDGTGWSFECDDHGLILRVTNPRGHETTYAYDRFGNRSERVDPDGGRTRYVHDLFGRLVQFEERNGRQLTYDYDARGWLIQVRRDGHSVARYAYDAEGNLTEIVDATGRVLSMTNSAWGHRISRTLRIRGSREPHAEDMTARFEYDQEGRVIRITDPGSRTVEFVFDECGRKKKTIFGDGSTEEFEYDAASNVVKLWRDGVEMIGYAYDAMNRLVEKTVAGGDRSTFTYDEMGRITEAANDWTTVSFRYDLMGNPIEESQGDARIRRAFDAMGNCTQLKSVDGAHIAYEYDPLQRPSSIISPEGGRHTLVHGDDFLMPEEHVLPNGLIETWHLDPLQRILTEQTTREGDPQHALAERTYHLDEIRRVVRIADAEGSESYRYDKAGRVLAVERNGSPLEQFQYDNSDNIVWDAESGPREYDACNRIRAGAGRRFHHSPLAVVKDDALGGSETRYEFDGQGRMLRVTSAGEERAVYRYDPFGRRIAKVIAGQEVRFWWDGTNLLREMDPSHDADNTYVFSPRTFRPLSKTSRSLENPSLPAHEYCYHLDTIGRPQRMTDGSGRVVWSARYCAYGRAEVRGNRPWLNPLRLPGQYHDEETGLHYNIYRYFDPILGRYVSEDPIGFAGSSLNLYSYPPDPINRTDALGLDCGDPDAMHIYHGTLDENSLRETGFTTKDRYGGEALPPYVCVSTDRAAAADAINPNARYDAQDAPAPAVLAGSVSRGEWDALHSDGHLSTNDYGGFGHGISSTETKARTPEGVAALNRAFGLPGG